jgi:metal-responsive CopG/Arc/MetJ family transcriptional regulator
MGRNKKPIEEKKSVLTLRLNENLLNKFDLIAEIKGDNRSELIEKLLIEYLKNKNNINVDEKGHNNTDK